MVRFFQQSTRGLSVLKDMGVNPKGTGVEQLENFKNETGKERELQS